MTREIFEIPYLSANLELTAAPARFLKEIIRVGTYRHPQRPRDAVEITPSRIEDWLENFYASPVKVWVPYRHSADPKDNTGWVEDLFVDDDRLFAVMRITDERAAALLRDGTIEDVSVGVEKDVVDMNGRHYDELIRHVALTLDPHIRNQQGFIPLGLVPEEEVKGGAKVPESKYAFVEKETGKGYYPHHRDDGDVDLAAVRKALADLADADLAPEVIKKIRQHLLAHLKKAGEEVAAEAYAGGPTLELEARLAVLDRKNRQLRRELRGARQESRRREEAAVAAEVADLVAQGKVLPAYAPHVQAILADGGNTTLSFEGERTNAATLLREIFTAMPPVVEFGEHFTLEPREDRVPHSPAEKNMLAALGVTEEDYRRYGGK